MVVLRSDGANAAMIAMPATDPRNANEYFGVFRCCLRGICKFCVL